MKRFVRRGNQTYPFTIDYECRRCLVKLPSQPMPADPSKLAIYGLPDGWELVSPPLPADDYLHCAECVKDIEGGSPEVLG